MSDIFDTRLRLFEILRRHVRDTDDELTDDEMVRVVVQRYRQERGWPLIDPNE